IDHHLAVRHPPCPHHAGAGQYRLPSRHAAPHVNAGIAWLAFVRKELLADGRIDAVAGDHGAAADRAADSAARPIGKMHADAGSILLDTNTVMTGDEAVAAGAGAKRIQQRHLQIAAMDRELRMFIARRAAERLLIDQLPEA